jgi:hypothetical protein
MSLHLTNSIQIANYDKRKAKTGIFALLRTGLTYHFCRTEGNKIIAGSHKSPLPAGWLTASGMFEGSITNIFLDT